MGYIRLAVEASSCLCCGFKCGSCTTFMAVNIPSLLFVRNVHNLYISLKSL